MLPSKAEDDEFLLSSVSFGVGVSKRAIPAKVKATPIDNVTDEKAEAYEPVKPIKPGTKMEAAINTTPTAM